MRRPGGVAPLGFPGERRSKLEDLIRREQLADSSEPAVGLASPIWLTARWRTSQQVLPMEECFEFC